MEWINKDIEKVPRIGNFQFRVNMLYFCRKHPAKIKQRTTPDDTLEITIRLGEKKTICEDIINGIQIKESFPNMVWKKPGGEHRFYDDLPRDSIAFGWPAESIEKLRELGLYSDLNSISFNMTPEIEHLINEFRQLCLHLYTRGVADKLDWICFQLYREVLYSNLLKSSSRSETEKLRNISIWLQVHFTEEIDLDAVARNNGFSRASFFRKWKTIFHVSPVQYILNLKIETAARLLRETDLPIQKIVQEINFSGTTAFHKKFYQTHGMTPKEYRDSHSLIN